MTKKARDNPIQRPTGAQPYPWRRRVPDAEREPEWWRMPIPGHAERAMPYAWWKEHWSADGRRVGKNAPGQDEARAVLRRDAAALAGGPGAATDCAANAVGNIDLCTQTAREI